MLQGLPASGKSTWARNWVNNSPNTRVRVNRDDIRRMLGPYFFTKEREKLVTLIESTAIREGLKKNFDVVIDATNLNPKVVNKWKTYVESIAKDQDIEFEIINFNTPVEECIIRDKNRKGDECVGEQVIMRMYNNYLKKDNDELVKSA